MTENQTQSLIFLSGGGEVGELIRTFNWADSPAGNPDDWPLSLLTTVSTLLSSTFPMLLWWGESYIQFYNDPFRLSLGHQGKHPDALGQRGLDCWGEHWRAIKRPIDRVMTGGDPLWVENQLFPIFRNGQTEDVYWTVGYSAVRTDTGQIGGVLATCLETTELVMAQQKLRQSELRFRTVFEQAPLGIALLSGRDMIIEAANEPMSAIWREGASVMGKPLIEVRSEIREQGLIDLLETVYDSGVPFFGRGYLVRLVRDGQLQDTYFNFVFTPRLDTSRTVTGVMIMATEVTAEREKEQILHQSLRREQELNQLKSRFVSIASHEFRRPLTTIQTSAELINLYLDKPQDLARPVIEKHLVDIYNQIEHMNELMTDLLTVGTIEAGKVAFHPHQTDVAVLCQYIIDRHFSNQPDGRVIHFSLNGLSRSALLDEKLMGHVLINLLTNALKFSQHDPRLELHFGDEAIIIQVIDLGIGIPASDLPSLFEPFFRAGNTGSIQGTGLGLVIARQFVELHGGSLRIQSVEGKGTTSTIVLPNSPTDIAS
ncbi:PAS domain-containing sensor histidine kinase [Spirosoma sp.]|uniref:PAS domain-containing sensor histidine kinase n=1 Tax=Spirosoma sp. TaxID=1899569 RepID=UPI0026040C83|nr:PAS domain-containing sensor histidine kinase [Spirosoma sp.]MCX6215820.1 PAS domain-containing sensor histidine kinase [Spirosoma sp.]